DIAFAAQLRRMEWVYRVRRILLVQPGGSRSPFGCECLLPGFIRYGLWGGVGFGVVKSSVGIRLSRSHNLSWPLLVPNLLGCASDFPINSLLCCWSKCRLLVGHLVCRRVLCLRARDDQAIFTNDYDRVIEFGLGVSFDRLFGTCVSHWCSSIGSSCTRFYQHGAVHSNGRCIGTGRGWLMGSRAAEVFHCSD